MLSAFDKKLLLHLSNSIKKKAYKLKKTSRTKLLKLKLNEAYEKYYAKMSIHLKKYFEIYVRLGTNNVIKKRYVSSTYFKELSFEIINLICKDKNCQVCGTPLYDPNLLLKKSTYYILFNTNKQFCNTSCAFKHASSVFWTDAKNNPSKLAVRSQKFKSTMIKRYGAPTTMESSVLKNKVQKTNIEKYGGICPAKSKAVAKKISQTLKGKYHE